MALQHSLDSYRLPLFSQDSTADLSSPGQESLLETGRSSADTLEQPTLQLQDVEGRIHIYEGVLSRKTKKAKLKNGWKRRWFRVIPGENS